MAIVGHGLDVVETSRVESMLLADSDAFSGWFTLSELEQLTQSAHRARAISARIAAKEAVAKALGTGFSEGVSWHDIEVSKTPLGAPQVALTGGALKLAAEVGITRILLSISHVKSMAIASAIALSE